MSCRVQESPSFIDIASQLKATKLFAGLGSNVIETLVENTALRTHNKGRLLFLHDDPAEWFYLISYGWVKLYRETIEGSQAVIDVLTNGHMFGENSVFENDRYSYSAEVVEETQLLMLPTALLKRLITEQNSLALNMLSSMSQTRKQQHQEIEHLNVQSAPQRIGCFLLRLCPTGKQHDITIHLPYDKTLIASRLGMKPETFSRALGKLKDAIDMKVSGSTVTIRSLDALVRFTCSQCSSSFPCQDLQS